MRRVLASTISAAVLTLGSPVLAAEVASEAPEPVVVVVPAPAAEEPSPPAPTVEPAGPEPMKVVKVIVVDDPPPPPRRKKKRIAVSAVTPAPEADKADASPPASETLRIGAIAGMGFPRPFAAEAFVKVKQSIGIGAEYSFLPDVTIMGADVRFRGMAADLRVFPFKGSVFLGVRGGRQWLEGTAAVSSEQVGTLNESAVATTWFVNPRIGLLKTFDSGVTVGIDAGVQVPISPTFVRTSDAADRYGYRTTDADKQLQLVAAVLGNRATPTVDLLRLGFLF